MKHTPFATLCLLLLALALPAAAVSPPDGSGGLLPPFERLWASISSLLGLDGSADEPSNRPAAALTAPPFHAPAPGTDAATASDGTDRGPAVDPNG